MNPGDIQAFRKEAKETGLRMYTPTPYNDLLLVDWWRRLRDAGELDKVFTSSFETLSFFLRSFHPPTSLFFTVEKDEHISLAVWVRPAMGSAFFNLWINKEHRKSKSSYRALLLAYRIVFQCYDTVLGVTKQEKLLRIHVKAGYTVIGKLAKIWDGEDAWLLQFTKEDFTKGWLNTAKS